MRRPTMRDVADRAGVSFKTVSRVVNGEAGVSVDLAQRVQAAVAELGYELDHRAQGLRRASSRSSTIGFVLVDVANQFFGSLLRGIDEVASARGSLVLSGSTDRDPEREHQLIRAFVGRRVDGLIVVYSGSEVERLETDTARGMPVVFLDLEPDNTTADLVRSDHYGGAKMATRHLLEGGHTDIAYFGDDATISSATLRRRGFLDAMHDAGINVPQERIVEGSRRHDQWRAIATEQLGSASPPTAVFSAQNIITVGTVLALHELNLQHCIAQVGFDDVDLARVVEPGITVVPQDPLYLGRRAAERLFDRIDGDRGPQAKEIVASDLIIRGSGEIRPPT